MENTCHILVVSDGKPGHENQSVGLAEAMARQSVVKFNILKLDVSRGLISRVRQALKDSEKFPKPDLVVGAGHGTHVVLLLLARKYGARSIVLMKPGLPMSWFDWCVVPEHDFQNPPKNDSVILSKGALNRVIPSPGERSGNLILVGGPSKNHSIDENDLVRQIEEVTADGEWELADSRRTPESFRQILMGAFPKVRLVPHEDCEKDWLARRLSSASKVWVTEDSVSMIYEALTGGAEVGILGMPRLKEDARVVKGLENLKAEGYILSEETKPVDPPRLAEADRCASIILSDQ